MAKIVDDHRLREETRARKKMEKDDLRDAEKGRVNFVLKNIDDLIKKNNLT